MATTSGAEVLWGRCWEAGGAPPYWPWAQAIRSHIREIDTGRLRRELGADAAEIAGVVAEVREQIHDLGPSPTIDEPLTARFRLFDSLTGFLKRVARGQPLVVVLDDLHWADDGSLRLLEFVARELADARLLLVGTYRDVELSRRHPLSQTLAELTRERLFERIVLRGLSSEDVAQFIEATCGISPPSALVSAVHAQTEGNPLFVTEVVRLLTQEGELTPERLSGSESWSMRIPEGVREVIGRRLDRLSDQVQRSTRRRFGHWSRVRPRPAEEAPRGRFRGSAPAAARGSALGAGDRGGDRGHRSLPVHPHPDPGDPRRRALTHTEGAPPCPDRRGARGPLRRGLRPTRR